MWVRAWARERESICVCVCVRVRVRGCERERETDPGGSGSGPAGGGCCCCGGFPPSDGLELVRVGLGLELEAAGVCAVAAADEEEEGGGGGDDDEAAAGEEVLQETSAAAASSLSPTDDISQASPFTDRDRQTHPACVLYIRSEQTLPDKRRNIYQPQHTITIIHLVYSEILYLSPAVLIASLSVGCRVGVAFGLGVWCEGEESMSPLRRREGPSSQLTDEVGGASFSSPSEPFTDLKNHVSNCA